MRGVGWGDQPAVSSVVGTSLMLALTLVVFTAFSLVVYARFGEEQEAVHADLAAVAQDGHVLLRHRGGESVAFADASLVLTVNGAPVQLGLEDLVDPAVVGATWDIGETICLAGPASAGCHFTAGQSITRLLLVSGGQVLVNGASGTLAATASASSTTSATGTSSSVSGTSSSSSSSSPTSGSGSSSSASSSSSSTTGPSCSGTQVLAASPVTLGSGWTGTTAAQLAAQDGTAATNSAGTPGSLVLAFADPTSGCRVSQVVLTMVQRVSDNDGWTMVSSLGGTCTSTSLSGSTTFQSRAVTCTGSWTTAQAAGLQATITPDKNQQQDSSIALDHVYATVTLVNP